MTILTYLFRTAEIQVQKQALSLLINMFLHLFSHRRNLQCFLPGPGRARRCWQSYTDSKYLFQKIRAKDAEKWKIRYRMLGFFYIGKFHRQNQAESHIFLENGYQIKQKFCIDTRRANHTSKKQVEASLSRSKAPPPKAPRRKRRRANLFQDYLLF